MDGGQRKVFLGMFFDSFDRKIEDDKNGIDDSDRWLKKVIVILGNEFAGFVNEETKADTAEGGGEMSEFAVVVVN